MTALRKIFSPLKSFRNKSGFTLIELLVSIAIIAVLAISVFAALNPVKRLQDARDSRRSSDIDSILTSIHQYIVDNKGVLPTGVSTTEKQLGTAATGCALATGGCSVAGATDCLDLSTTLNKYLKSIPTDPNGGSSSLTKYSVVADANNIITVKACGVEGSTNISTSR